MIAINTNPLFEAGRLLATPGAIEAFEAAGQSISEFLRLHLYGNWGTLDDEDKSLNDQSVSDGSRILSAYVLKTGVKIWRLNRRSGEVCLGITKDGRS